MHEHSGDVLWKPCPLPEALWKPQAQRSRCDHFPSTAQRENTHGLAGLTACGSSRMHAPKQPRPGAVLTEREEDFPVHRFPELSARMLCLKNSSPSPLCFLYSKVKNVIVDA